MFVQITFKLGIPLVLLFPGLPLIHILCFVSYPFREALTEITPHSTVLLSFQEKHMLFTLPSP